MNQIISTNPTQFKDASGNWKMRITGVKTTAAQFDWNGDLLQYETLTFNYELSLAEKFTNCDYNEINEELCIYTGTLSPDENLQVEISIGTSWTPLMTLTAGWNNASVSNYLSSANFTIRFKGATETGDTSQSTWQIDCVLLHTWSPESNTLEVWLYNYGKIDMTVSSVYVDGILPPSPPEPIQIAMGGHNSTTVLPTGGGWTSGKTYHLKLVTDRGSAFEGDFVAP